MKIYQLKFPDFVNNPLLKDFKIKQNKIIEIIKSSHKYHYDTKTQLIKLKEKADRNILIINNFNPQTSNQNEQIEYIKSIINEFSETYFSKIRKIDQIGSGYHIVFDHEDVSMEVEKYFLWLTEINKQEIKNEEKLKEMKSFKESSELYASLKQAQICLAAESLKRRIVNRFEENTDITKQQEFICNVLSKSISNPKKSTENHKKSTDNHKKSTTSPNEKEQKEIKIEAKENLNQQKHKI